MGESSGLSYSALASRALDEAMELLAEVEFDAVRGAYRQGELTAVSVMVDSQSDPEVCHIRVMCHDPGHLGIGWDGLALFLVDRETDEERIGFLDHRGRAEFVAAMHGSRGFGFSGVKVAGLTNVLVPAGMLGDGHLEPSGVPPPEWRVEGSSPDGALYAQVEALGHMQLEITVRADINRFPALRFAKVHVVLRSRSNPSEIWLHSTITLEGEDGAAGSRRDRIKIPGLGGRAAEGMLLVFAGLK